MDEKAIKRRNWVKNILIIFLAVMLVLTLFSSTILNFSLPEVAAQYCYSGIISTRIRQSGNVEASENYSAKSEIGGKVKTVGIKEGMFVEAGTVMYVLEAGKSENLIDAKKELANFLKEYNDLLGAAGGDLSQYLDAISEAQAIYDETVKARSDAAKAKEKLIILNEESRTYGKDIDKLTTRQSSLKNKINSLNSIDGIDEAKGILDEAKTDLETKYNALEAGKAAKRNAQNAVTEYTSLLANAEKALTDFKKDLPEKANDAELRALEQALEDLNREYLRAMQRYNDKITEYNTELARLNVAWEDAYNEMQYRLSLLGSAATEEEREMAQTNYDNAKAAFNAAQAALDNHKESISNSLQADQWALEDQRINIERKQAELDAKYAQNLDYSVYEGQLKNLESNIEIAKKKLSDAERALEEAKLALDGVDSDSITLQTEYNDAKKLVELLEGADSLTALTAELDSVEAQLETTNDKKSDIDKEIGELNGIVSAAPGDSTLDRNRNSLTKAKNDYAKAKEKLSGNEDVNELELEIVNQKIKDQEAKIKKIEDGEEDGEIKAPISGNITQVNYRAGDEIVMNETVALIQIPESGYKMRITITAEQSRRIKVGDTASVQNYWWGETPKVVVESIVTDPNNPQQSRIVNLKVTGDIAVGSQLSITLGEKSQNYDIVVPNSAVKEDNNGKFVLVVMAKSTPLGNRFSARRVDVQVVDSDDMNSAVMGLSPGDFVITTSAKPISSGMQVRLSES